MNNALPPGACSRFERFRKLRRIGEGTYGLVYRAHDGLTGATVALKRVLMHNESDDGFPLTSIREVITLRECAGHAAVVRLLEVAAGPRTCDIYLVLEYCEHDLADLLAAVPHPCFSESEAKCVARQLSSALQHMHSMRIVHRDLKLSNLLYNNRGEVKVADFGMARHISSAAGGGGERRGPALTGKVTTLWYRAPEVLLGDVHYSCAVDLWALGCVLGELHTGRPLLPGRDDTDQLQCMFELLGCPSERIWPSLADPPLAASLDLHSQQHKYVYNNLSTVVTASEQSLVFLNALLVYDPQRRLTARQACEHEYFRSSPLPQEPALMPTFPSRHGSAAGTTADDGDDRKRRRSGGHRHHSSHHNKKQR